MFFMKKEHYVFLYGKHQGEVVMKKKYDRKKFLSFLIPVAGVVGFITGTGISGSVGLVVLFGCTIWLVPELLIKQRCNEMRTLFKLEMPDFLDVTALLLEAGQPIWYAVKTASSMGDSQLCIRINSIFYCEGGMEDSRNPEILLQRLSEELKVPEVSSAVSAIVQNSRKGEKALASVLRIQSNICRQERKAIAQELGNRASNMLLIPSGMVFAAILIMLIAPAIIQLNIF